MKRLISAATISTAIVMSAASAVLASGVHNDAQDWAAPTQINSSDPVNSGLNQGANCLTFSTQDNTCTTQGQPKASTPTTTTKPKSTTQTATQNSQNQQVTQGTGIYAALGDSIAAGAGLPLAGGPDVDARCARSVQAYPYKVAVAKNMKLMHVACSGATAGDLVTRQGVSGPNIQSQLDAAFAAGRPDLITITAGANDLHWQTFLQKCAAATCGSDADTAATAALRTAMELKLKFAFAEIQAKSNGNPPPVIVTGYSNPVSNYCIGKQDFADRNEIKWLNGQRDKLNNSIRSAMSGFKFVKYASTNFNGHAVCSPDSWVQGLNDMAPLHPNNEGQQLIADSILKVLR